MLLWLGSTFPTADGNDCCKALGESRSHNQKGIELDNVLDRLDYCTSVAIHNLQHVKMS